VSGFASRLFDFGMHVGNHLGTSRSSVDTGRDRSDIRKNVPDCAWRVTQEANARFPNFNQRCFLIRHRRNHQVRPRRQYFAAFRGPGMGNDQWFTIPKLGTTSAQYLVQATTRSRAPTLAKTTVALDSRQTIRRGQCG
jgi:hypothetical protein